MSIYRPLRPVGVQCGHLLNEDFTRHPSSGKIKGFERQLLVKSSRMLFATHVLFGVKD